MLKILIICTANVCRSAASQAFLNQMLQGRGALVESAGTMAIDGNSADQTIVTLLSSRGYPEIGHHFSRALMPHHLDSYELILCMERVHLNRLHSLSPITVGKSMLLGHWDGGCEVPDPFGRSNETYVRSVDQMHLLCQQWATKIIAMGLVT